MFPAICHAGVMRTNGYDNGAAILGCTGQMGARKVMTALISSAKQRAQIVIEGLRGQPLADLCHKYGISESKYYQWRDEFLARVPCSLRGPRFSGPATLAAHKGK